MVRLPLELAGNILAARQAGLPSLCAEDLMTWLARELASAPLDEEYQQEVRAECALYFVQTLFPHIKGMGVHCVRAYVQRGINLHCLHILRAMRSPHLALEKYRRHLEATIRKQTRADAEVHLSEILGANKGAVLRVADGLARGLSSADIARGAGVGRSAVCEAMKRIRCVP